MAEGFWATLDWWLERTEEFVNADWVPNRVAMIGRYDTGLGLAPSDRPLHAQRGPVRHARVRGVRRAARRGPRRRRRRDARLDAGLGRRALPGRAGLRGARPRPDPPQARAARAARAADPGVHGGAPRAGSPRRDATSPPGSCVRRSCGSPHHPWFRQSPRGPPPGRAVASRFVAGETLAEAMAAARDLDRQRIAVMLDHLGENVRRPRRRSRRGRPTSPRWRRSPRHDTLDCAISVKLTQLGLDDGGRACLANLDADPGRRGRRPARA